MFLPKSKKLSTFLKYLLSYFLIFTVLMSAFFLILRTQLSEAYGSQQQERIRSQLSAVRDNLENEVIFLSLIDSMIVSNSDIVIAAYMTDGRYLSGAVRELNQYANSCLLLNTIVLHSFHNDHTFSSGLYTDYVDGQFILTNSNNKKTVFDPQPWLNVSSGQLIWLHKGGDSYLIYFPPHQNGARYLYLYILDTQVIRERLKGLLSEEVPAVVLLDAQGNCVTGYGMGEYASRIAEAYNGQTMVSLTDGNSILLSDALPSGFRVAAVISGDYLSHQVDQAFMKAFFSLLGLSVLGILVVYVAMLFTYRPLQRLAKNLGHETGRHQNYLELISKNYSALSDQKAQLEQTLAQYRKSLDRYLQRCAYPHDELGQLSSLLTEKQFAQARDHVESLLSHFDGEPGYFLSCIILDCLTVITNSMSKAHIEFDTYAEVFSRAVRQCRDIQHIQDFKELMSLINELLFFYETEAMDQLLHTTPLRKMVENNFCDANFSISVLASAYHVSDSRMSTLFKEEMGIGFTECVWQMRLEKAQQLLRETQMSLEEISFAVGYLAHSSFGRKFKQATGMTPSQYRSQFPGTQEATD